MKNKKFCSWAMGSTNLKTMELELPDECKRRGCKGFFDENIKPLCEDFILVPESQKEQFITHFNKLNIEEN